MAPVELQRIYVDRMARTRRGRRVDVTLRRAGASVGHGRLLVGVWQKNPRAIAFYQRSGFTTVGVATFRVGRDVQHDFVMARPLR